MNAGPDLLVRHLLAQQSKAFFGYGPKGRAAVVLQGRLAVFTSELAGPDMVAALRADPFGRLCMRHINRLYVERNREELARLACAAGVTLVGVGSDIDFEAGVSVGVAVAEAPLPGAAADRAAEAGSVYARAFARVPGTPAEVRVGSALAYAWVDGAPQGPAGSPAAVLAGLEAEAERSAAAGAAIRSALGPRCAAAFLVPAGGRRLAGALLRR
jgi:hypothetical protein